MEQDGVTEAGLSGGAPDDLIPVIDYDLPCRRCGYNLRGLTGHHDCPECGTHIARSLSSNDIEHCYPGWVRVITCGFGWLIAGFVIDIVGSVCDFFLHILSIRYTRFTDGLDLFLAAPIVIGVWFVTTTEPGETCRRIGARLLARYLCIGSYLLAVSKVLLDGRFPWVRFYASFFALFFMFVTIILLLQYLSGFAERVKKPSLKWQCALLKWCYVFQLATTVFYMAMLALIFNSRNTAWFSYIDPLYCGHIVLYLGLMTWLLILVIMFRRTFVRAMRFAQWDWANKVDFSRAYKERRRHSYLKS